MKKHKLLFLGAALAAMPFVASAQTDTPFNKTGYVDENNTTWPTWNPNGNAWNGKPNRLLINFKLHNESGSTQPDVTFNVNQNTNKTVFRDLTTASSFVTAPGATVKLTELNWNGEKEWMHAYLFIDVDNDEGFNAFLNDANYPSTPPEGFNVLQAPSGKAGDLMTFSAYDIGTSSSEVWVNSIGKTVGNNPGVNPDAIPSFNIPQNITPGKHLALFKLDWNSLEQHGSRESGNDIGTNAGCVVLFYIEIEEIGTPCTITIASNNDEYGTVKFQGEENGVAQATKEFTGGQSVTVIATANQNYQFEKWVNGSNVVSTSATYTFTCAEDVNLVAYFKEANGTTDRYPVMTRFWTGENDPKGRNRFLKKIVVSADDSDGSNPLVEQVIDITNEAEILKDLNNVVIDKTAYPIVVEKGTSTFNITFFGWTDALNIGGANREAQLDWTQEAHFIDWNNDGDFTDEGECIGKGYDHYGSLTWNANTGSHILTDGETAQVRVPENQAAGDYRIRIVFFEDADPDNVQWQEKLFDKNEYNNQIRNGVAYDFTIHIVEASYNKWVPSLNVSEGKFTSTTTYDIKGLPSHHSLKAKMTVVKQNESGIAAIANYDEETTVDEQPLGEDNSVTLTATELDPDSQYLCTVKLYHAGSDTELLHSEPMAYLVDTNGEGSTVGVNDLTVTETETAPRYYNLQGIEVAQPTSAGIYIVRQGNKVSKVYVK